MVFDDNPPARRAHHRAARRIAILSDQASPLAPPGSSGYGGQSVYVANLACELALCGHLVDIFTRRAAPSHAALVNWRPNVRVVHVPAGPAQSIPGGQVLPQMDRFARFVARFARRHNAVYDVVHANFFMSGGVARHLEKTLGAPIVITVHAPDAGRIIDGFPQAMQQLHGVQDTSIDVAPCGFDPQELWPLPPRLARQKLGLPLGKFIVLQLGRIAPRKGIDTLIEGLALLRRQHGADAMLLVVGGENGPPGRRPTPELARLRELARGCGVGEHVQFTGHKERAQLRYYYGAADAFAGTPWHAPSAITPVEAMACARPVIGAAVGAINRAVLDGSTGFLVPARDPPALAERLALLHAAPDLARAMGDEGMRRAHQHFTWSAVARQAAATYEAALAQAAAPSMPTPHRSNHVPSAE
jgi:D-inositol-3-phosphate glycosyltransferase